MSSQETVGRSQEAVRPGASIPLPLIELKDVKTHFFLREGTVRDWARQAGFRHVQTLPIDNDFWRFYRLDA